MQYYETPIENRFGEAVLDGRHRQGLSQKAMADLLTERGLAVDASAISRIEKGTRAIRLSEAAIIADVLGFSLADLERTRDPRDDLARLQNSIEAGLNASYLGAYQVSTAMDEIDWILGNEPQLLESLGDFGSTLTSFSQYVKSVEDAWYKKHDMARAVGYAFESIEVRNAVSSLIRNVAGLAVDSAQNAKEDWWDASKGDEDGEHPEAP